MQFINTNMELIIEPFDALPCVLKIFTINGKKADSDNFGNTFDHINGEKEVYGCCNMYFEPNPPAKEVLYKYNITEEEYYGICNELENKLHVGSCGWCI